VVTRGRLTGWWSRTAYDLRRLWEEPVLGVAVAGIFGLLLVFILYPLARVLTVSLFPEGALTLKLYREFLASWFIRQAFVNSVVMGVLTAVGGTAVGFLFAFTLTRTDIPGKGFLTLSAILPVISPPFVSALSIILLFGNNGLITRQLLGLQDFAIYGLRGLLLSQVFTFFPVAYLTLRGILESLGGTLEDAAMNLGATRWKAFRRVTLPLCLPGLASAFLVLFIESIADFGNPLILGGSGFPVLSVQVYLQVTGMYDLPGGAALAVILLVPSVTTFLVQRYWVARKRYVTVTGKPTRAVIRAVSPGMQWTLFAACGAVALFVLLFYATIVVGAFSRAWGADHSLTLRNFGYVFAVGAQAIKDTLIIAVTSSPLAGLLGMAIAFLVSRRRFPGRQAMEFISILNFAVPGTVIGIGYILAFNQRPLLLTGTALILITNFLFRYIPVGIQSGMAGLRQIDPSIEEAATNLGASSHVTFRRITLPLLVPAFFSGLVFSFVRAMTAISAAIFLVSADWNLMTVQILSQTEAGRLGAAAAFSVLLILIILLAIGVIRLILGQLFEYRYEAAFG
jgi:iron(III) transport system permease protein